MNLLQRALIEKAGHDHGFEHVLSGPADAIRLGSARHRAQDCIKPRPEGFRLIVSSPIVGRLSVELARSYPAVVRVDDAFVAPSLDVLAGRLSRAAALAQALPTQAEVHFQEQVQFDRFLITFSEEGSLIVSSAVTAPERELLGLSKPLRLRWLTPEHLPYLQFHQARYRASA